MHGHRHVARPFTNAVVDQMSVLRRQLVGILSDRAHFGAQFRITQVGEVHFVDLQVSATRRSQLRDLLAVDSSDVGIESVHLRIRRRINSAASTAEVQHGRRWNGELRGLPGVLLQEPEMLDKNGVGACDPAGHAGGGRRPLDRTCGGVKARLHGRARGFDVRETCQEIHVPQGAPELSIRNRTQAAVFLERDDLSYGGIFQFRQLAARESAVAMSLACLDETCRTQQRAHMIGAKGRRLALEHASSGVR